MDDNNRVGDTNNIQKKIFKKGTVDKIVGLQETIYIFLGIFIFCIVFGVIFLYIGYDILHPEWGYTSGGEDIFEPFFYFIHHSAAAGLIILLSIAAVGGAIISPIIFILSKKQLKKAVNEIGEENLYLEFKKCGYDTQTGEELYVISDENNQKEEQKSS